jgi:predicted RNA polymerase sigma factor
MVLDAIYAAFTRGWQSSLEDETGCAIEAKAAFERAIGLCADPVPRAYLWDRRNRI